MKINLITCFFILDNETSENIKKNDIKTLKLLVTKNNHFLPNVYFKEEDTLKEEVRDYLEDITGTKKFHLEQVYTLADKKFYDDKNIDIIHLALTNIENIKKLKDNFELITINFEKNDYCLIGNDKINYKSIKVKSNSNIEYRYKIETDDIKLEKEILELIIAFKHLKSRIDFSDVMFKLLPEKFSLEDTRILYELITNKTVDKSNFRKKIIKYCEKTEEIIKNKGYRPTLLYKYKLDDEIWL